METYPEMNNKIKDILRINSDNPVDLYAAQRIEDLESDLKAVTAQRDKAIEFGAKLVRLCFVPSKERDKVFRRKHIGAGDYMGSGYDFIDAFEKIWEEFTETATDEFYNAIIAEANKERVEDKQ